MAFVKHKLPCNKCGGSDPVSLDDKGAGFIIKKGKIRGEESFGMLCSEKELTISENHN